MTRPAVVDVRRKHDFRAPHLVTSQALVDERFVREGLLVGPRKVGRNLDRFLVVETERRHPHVQPRPDRRHVAKEPEQPLRLYFPSFPIQGRWRESDRFGLAHAVRYIRTRQDFLDGAPFIFNDVTPLAVPFINVFSALLDLCFCRRKVSHGRRLHETLTETKEGQRQSVRIVVAQAEVGHAQLVLVGLYFPFIPNSRQLELREEPVLPRVRHVQRVQGKIEFCHVFAALQRQFRTDRGHVFESLDRVTAVTALPCDHPLTQEHVPVVI